MVYVLVFSIWYILSVGMVALIMSLYSILFAYRIASAWGKVGELTLLKPLAKERLAN